MPRIIMLSWLVLLPLTLLRRNMRRPLSLGPRTEVEARTSRRGMRLRPAKRTRLLGNHRSQRKKTENKQWEGAVFFYIYIPLCKLSRCHRGGLHKKLYPTY